jgi:peptidoglycan/LPS O-acetylase OafA/YrhL
MTRREQPRRDIPSLDGLRAVSIAIVILAHVSWWLPDGVKRFWIFHHLVGGGLHGVQIFFVISGYLITALLLREWKGAGGVSLKRFYLRRVLRIFPPFYAYLAVLGVLWAAGAIQEHWPSFLAAATYTIAYMPDPQGWFVQHTWSLSLEEQFYLLWPAIFLWAQRRGKTAETALVLMAAMPAVRLALHFAAPHLAGAESHTMVTYGSGDTILMGCLLAALRGHPQWERWRRRWVNGWTAGAMAFLSMVLVPYVVFRMTGGMSTLVALALGNTVTAAAIGWVLVYVVENATSPAGRVLNSRVMRHVGLISYSLYLWQQLFTSDKVRMTPYGLLGMWMAAELSFRLIERPAGRLRARLEAAATQ